MKKNYLADDEIAISDPTLATAAAVVKKADIGRPMRDIEDAALDLDRAQRDLDAKAADLAARREQERQVELRRIELRRVWDESLRHLEVGRNRLEWFTTRLGKLDEEICWRLITEQSLSDHIREALEVEFMTRRRAEWVQRCEQKVATAEADLKSFNEQHGCS